MRATSEGCELELAGPPVHRVDPGDQSLVDVDQVEQFGRRHAVLRDDDHAVDVEHRRHAAVAAHGGERVRHGR
jgi:hypothetical protein